MSVYFKTDGMTKADAEEMRKQGAEVWGCWWCLNEAKPHGGLNQKERPYWFSDDLIFRGHRLACPKHKETEP